VLLCGELIHNGMEMNQMLSNTISIYIGILI
jgi:hypothetical protein